jgi:hypothetical protein
MPVSRCRTPKYRHYKPKHLAVVRIDGKDVYLGRYDSPESWEKYHRLVAEWLAGGRQLLPSHDQLNGEDHCPQVSQLILAYWSFAKSHYVKDGLPTRELEGIREALRPLRRLPPRIPLDDPVHMLAFSQVAEVLAVVVVRIHSHQQLVLGDLPGQLDSLVQEHRRPFLAMRLPGRNSQCIR